MTQANLRGHDEAAMVQTVKVGHNKEQVTCFLNREESVKGDINVNVDLKMFYLDLGTLIPEALSKHFIAAPTAVSNW